MKTLSRTLRALLLLLVLAAATQAQSSADPVLTLTGKLVIPDGAGTKQSYFSGNFQLVSKAGSHIVSGSEAVSEETLESFVGKSVKVRAQLVPAQKPHPDEQAPMGPDGRLLDHPAYYRIQSIELANP